MILKILATIAFFCSIAPLQAQSVTELKSVISIQQAQIKTLQNELQDLKKPVLIKTILSGTAFGTAPSCGSVCEENRMICLDGRLGKPRPIRGIGDTKTRNLGCYASASSNESFSAVCVCMEVDGL